MKRREFVAASALLALFAGGPAHAAKKQVAKVQSKPAPKASSKPAAKSSARTTAAAAAQEAPTHSEAPRNAIALPDEPNVQWRHYALHSTIAFRNTDGKTRVWLPLPQYRDTAWARTLEHEWQGNFGRAGTYRDPISDLEVFYADWDNSTAEATLQLVSHVATQDRHFDITRRNALAERTEILRRCLRATELVPNDGIVRRTAERVLGRIKDPLAQAKALYDWVVDNTAYDTQAATRPPAHIGQMLESGNLNGNSTDIAQLFCGLCRSIGIPARPVFGLRIDRSRLFDSLGASGELHEARRCRAEFYSPGYGWIPVNPADVRQAAVSEHLGPTDSKFTVLKKLLFGFWEMNWIGFNAAQDIILPDTTTALPILDGPLLVTRANRTDTAAGTAFRYNVHAEPR